MRILNLKLYNFRNYDKLEINFDEKFNLIYGKNGQGKTNLVESIYVLALTKSFRGTVDKALVMNNCDFTRIDAEVVKKRKNNFKLIISKDGKRIKVNDVVISKLSDYISQIGVVLFNPDDLRIIKDSPNTRRKSLNVDISLISNSYLKYLNGYNKVLKQRNAYLKVLLKDNQTSSDYLDSLTEQLIGYGVKVYNERLKILEIISFNIRKIYEQIMGQGKLEIRYSSDFSNKSFDELKNLYKSSIKRDLFLGTTSVGIHKDDYLFYLDDIYMRDYGSEGQQKNAIIAYKFALIKIYESVTNDLPILILDDLFSELDVEKINNVLNLIDDRLQVFITTTEIDNVDEKFMFKSRKFLVENGKIMEEKI